MSQIEETAEAYSESCRHGLGIEVFSTDHGIDKHLLHHSPVPMLVILLLRSAGYRCQFRRIMVTTDLSKGTAQALKYRFPSLARTVI
jgi:hypothetical protein